MGLRSSGTWRAVTETDDSGFVVIEPFPVPLKIL